MYSDVLAGLKERFETVSDIVLVLDYEPNSIQAAPAVTMILDTFTRKQVGQITEMTYRVRCRLWIKWTDNQKAEQRLVPLVNVLPAAIDADPQLGGRVDSGIAQVPSATGGWVEMGGVLYRTMDVFAEVLEKAVYQSGI